MEPSQTVDASIDDPVHLKRTIGLTTGCSLIIGGIIGSGIFVSPQGVLIGAGSPGLSLIVWTICGVLSMIGALTYAEIGTTIPKSGAAYYAFRVIYGDGAAFVYMLTLVFFIFPASTAIVSMTFSEYMMAIFFNDGCGPPPQNITRMMATTVVVLVAAINIWSVSGTSKVSVFFTTAKITALIIIILGGVVYLAQGKTDYLNPDISFRDTSTNAASLAEAFLSGMFAYAGWDGLNFLVEELKQPERNLPLAILISVPVVTIVYILTNISYFGVLSSDEITSSTTVAMTWANVVIPNVSWFVPLAVAVSTFGSAVGSMLLKSRLVYVSARENHLPYVLSMVNINCYTPVPAVFLLAVLSVMYIYTATIMQLIGYTMLALWVFHGMVGFGVLLLRYQKKDMHRPYKVPIICPIILLLFSIFLTLAPLIGNPQWGYFFALSLILVGALLWLLCVKCGIHLPGMGQVTKVVQLYGRVAPSQVSTQATKEDNVNELDEDCQNSHNETGGDQKTAMPSKRHVTEKHKDNTMTHL